MIGPYVVGQVPAGPLVISVTADDGTDRDLTSYTSIQFLIYAPDGSRVDTSGCTVDPIDPAQPSTVVVHWASVSLFTVPGTYTYQLELDGPGAVHDLTGLGSFQVLAVGAITAWCTLDDVTTFTGASPEPVDLMRAQAAIDIHSGRSIDVAPRIWARDKHYLRLATAYQCAWQMAQPDLFTRSDVTQVSQDGANASLHDGALTLAPLARRALRRVSWRQSRSVEARSPFVSGSGYPLGGPVIDYDFEAWSAMEGSVGSG